MVSLHRPGVGMGNRWFGILLECVAVLVGEGSLGHKSPWSGLETRVLLQSIHLNMLTSKWANTKSSSYSLDPSPTGQPFYHLQLQSFGVAC